MVLFTRLLDICLLLMGCGKALTDNHVFEFRLQSHLTVTRFTSDGDVLDTNEIITAMEDIRKIVLLAFQQVSEDVENVAIGAINVTKPNEIDLPFGITLKTAENSKIDAAYVKILEDESNAYIVSKNFTLISADGNFSLSLNDQSTFSMMDFDECSSETHFCSINATCINKKYVYTFTCICKDGFTGDGKICCTDGSIQSGMECLMHEDTPVYVWIIIAAIGGVLFIIILAVFIGFRKCEDGKWVRRTSGAMELRHVRPSRRDNSRPSNGTFNSTIDSRTSDQIAQEADQARLINSPDRQDVTVQLHPAMGAAHSLSTTRPLSTSESLPYTNMPPASHQKFGLRKMSSPPTIQSLDRSIGDEMSGSQTMPRNYREDFIPIKITPSTEGRKSKLKNSASDYRPPLYKLPENAGFEKQNEFNGDPHDEQLYDEPEIGMTSEELPRTASYSYDQPENQPQLEAQELPRTSSDTYDVPENLRFPIAHVSKSPFANNIEIPKPLPKTPEESSLSKPLPKTPDEISSQEQNSEKVLRSSSYENIDDTRSEHSFDNQAGRKDRSRSYENVDDIGGDDEEEKYQNFDTLDVPFARGNKGYDSDYDSDNSFVSGDEVEQADPDQPPVVIRTKKPRSYSEKKPPPVPKQKPKSRRALSCYENVTDDIGARKEIAPIFE